MTIHPTAADHAARVVLAVLDADRTALTAVLGDVADAPDIDGVDAVTRLVTVLGHDLAGLLVALHGGDKDAVRAEVRAGIIQRAG